MLVTFLNCSDGFCPSHKLAIRIVAGTWCLVCFVLITAYSSVLVSYIVAPNLKPIIDAIEDMPNVPGLQMVTVKDSSIDNFFIVRIFTIYFKAFHLNIYNFLQNYPKTLYKYWYVGNQLRENPSLRCTKIDICIDKVRSENNKVYADVICIFIKTIGRISLRIFY